MVLNSQISQIIPGANRPFPSLISSCTQRARSSPSRPRHFARAIISDARPWIDPEMASRIAQTSLLLSAPALLLASVLPGEGAAVVFGLLAAAFPVTLVAFAVTVTPGARLGRRRGATLVTLLLLLEGGMVALLALRGSVARSLEAVPAGILVQLGVLWLAPLVLVVLGYAATFDDRRSGASSAPGGGPSSREDAAAPEPPP